ncbi:MAG: Mu P family protein [bacterium]|nr:Mu P family protein [bacterium]
MTDTFDPTELLHSIGVVTPDDIIFRNDLSIKIGNTVLRGWTSIRITRGIERCPPDFEVSMTERYPGEFNELLMTPRAGQYSGLLMKPGADCEVMSGKDLIMTGYVDRYMPSLDAGSHSITVTGRGKCQDLVDCSTLVKGGQIIDGDALTVAQTLANPFKVTVKQQAGCKTKVDYQQFNVIPGETPWTIIERVCRNAAVLCYETPDGNILLAHASDEYAGSGFEEGVNIERATAIFSMDQRYSEYHAQLLSFNPLWDIYAPDARQPDANKVFTVTDPYVLRHRPLVVVAEIGVGYLDMLMRRTAWESARRKGRSSEVRITTDGWRDVNRNLYRPNTRVHLSIPSLKIKGGEWLISEVTYRLDESGTHADLVIMPPAAFLPEPVILQPLLGDVIADLNRPPASL